MAHRSELVADRWGDAVLKLQLLTLGPDSWGLDGLLQRHAVVDHVDDRLEHRREDSGAAWGAQRHERLAVLQHDRRRHAAEHPFAGRDRVRVARMRVEDVHRVVQEHARARDRHLGAERGVDRLSHRDHVALVVGDREVRRVGRLPEDRGWIARREAARRLDVDLRSAPSRVLLRGQRVDWSLDERRIAHVLVAVGEPDLQRLGHQVHARRGAKPDSPDVEALQDVEQLHDVRAARARRRNRDDLVASVVASDRLSMAELVPVEVGAGDDSAVRGHVVDDHLTDLAAIQNVGTVTRDGSQGACIVAPHDGVAGLRR